MSFRENHWRGLADRHTMAFTCVVTHAVRPNSYTTSGDVTAVVLACCLTACEDQHSSALRWHGTITILLPGRLSSASGNACQLRSGTPWHDVRAGAPVSIRTGAGQVLATWTLPAGPVLPPARGRGCRFVLTQSDGFEADFHNYSLRMASHRLNVPPKNIVGNLFIELPNRPYTRLIRVSGSD